MKTGMLINSGGTGKKSSNIVDVLPILSGRIAELIKNLTFSDENQLEEIRLRAGRPIILQNFNSEWFVDRKGNLTRNPSEGFIVSQEDISITVELMSENSVYAYQDEIRNGYITIRGGHRIGLAGRVVTEDGIIKSIKDISGLNIRFSNQVFGCSKKIIGYLLKSKNDIYNTLVISPPQCGKTTILRDIARNLSNGIAEYNFKGIKVGIVDERSELAACVKGIPQNDVGIRTDVLDGCPKSIGMLMLIRSMSPNVIITDEIGNEGDREAVISVLNAGVKIITSAHGYNISELKSRREVLKLIEDGVFERYVVLGNSNGPGTLVEVVDGINMKPLRS